MFFQLDSAKLRANYPFYFMLPVHLLHGLCIVKRDIENFNNEAFCTAIQMLTTKFFKYLTNV